MLLLNSYTPESLLASSSVASGLAVIFSLFHILGVVRRRIIREGYYAQLRAAQVNRGILFYNIFTMVFYCPLIWILTALDFDNKDLHICQGSVLWGVLAYTIQNILLYRLLLAKSDLVDGITLPSPNDSLSHSHPCGQVKKLIWRFLHFVFFPAVLFSTLAGLPFGGIPWVSTEARFFTYEGRTYCGFVIPLPVVFLMGITDTAVSITLLGLFVHALARPFREESRVRNRGTIWRTVSWTVAAVLSTFWFFLLGAILAVNHPIMAYGIVVVWATLDVIVNIVVINMTWDPIFYYTVAAFMLQQCMSEKEKSSTTDYKSQDTKSNANSSHINTGMNNSSHINNTNTAIAGMSHTRRSVIQSKDRRSLYSVHGFSHSMASGVSHIPAINIANHCPLPSPRISHAKSLKALESSSASLPLGYNGGPESAIELETIPGPGPGIGPAPAPAPASGHGPGPRSQSSSGLGLGSGTPSRAGSRGESSPGALDAPRSGLGSPEGLVRVGLYLNQRGHLSTRKSVSISQSVSKTRSTVSNSQSISVTRTVSNSRSKRSSFQMPTRCSTAKGIIPSGSNVAITRKSVFRGVLRKGEKEKDLNHNSDHNKHNHQINAKDAKDDKDATYAKDIKDDKDDKDDKYDEDNPG